MCNLYASCSPENIAMKFADWETWLNGTVEQANALIKLPPLELFRHSAADPNKQVELPIKIEH